ncbi:G/U mismatch-specific uracil DNA glycosylase (EC [Amycolatopsis camponoti]|uniref:G/U mismatch-specific uracil DNA glycosylase (EC) n=1 Tax=Amycolatopsis camponoti TaxID=2606593 RepID=A0A6I8M030_9PSEU|nr:G/U mismatch-specific DNA glycosylase [Amycolatopsis camponoti]VVJ22173.1 G/U mismatch-specific uracil DNA glycosylase (EC [Amycolatopsis camponoti]
MTVPDTAVLPDVLDEDLRVVFVGINPGLTSAAAGHSFHTPGNRFWPALHRAGFTPRQLRAEEERLLLGWGLGITSIVRRPTARAAQLSRDELVAGGRDLAERVGAIRPRWLAMLGVTGYRAAFGLPRARLGPQDATIGGARVWVVPNPSGLNAHFPPRALAVEFARMRVAAGVPDRSGILGDGPFPDSAPR